MTTKDTNMTPTSDVRTLAELRALAPRGAGSIGDALNTADRQAAFLRGQLAAASDRMEVSLAVLMPSITVESVDDIPVAGLSFWAADHWRIHIRSSDPADVQISTVFRELKYIIDYPVRGQATELSSTDREAVANHFAARVLEQESSDSIDDGPEAQPFNITLRPARRVTATRGASK